MPKLGFRGGLFNLGRATLFTAAVTAAALAAGPALAAMHFHQTNLVTDSQNFLVSQGFSHAVTTDPGLINPWGVSYAPTGPFWVSNQGTGTSTLYNGAGAKVPLTVTVPGSTTGPTGPTGQVFYGGSSFLLPNGTPGRFFFANLDGSISGWNPAAGTTAQVVVPSGRPAVYTGLALAASGGATYLYAANEATGSIDVFDQNFAPATLAGGFVDPGPNPDGLVPFNVQAIGESLYVTYATPGPDADEAPLGSGFVSVFSTDGTFIRRFATGGQLLSPWGVTRAPAGFGPFGGAILIGNFSDSLGYINAFDPETGTLLGALSDGNGNAYNIPYLWALTFGNGGAGGLTSQLYFSAGIGDEVHGLLGTFGAVPEPGSWALLLAGFGFMGLQLRRKRRGTIIAG